MFDAEKWDSRIIRLKSWISQIFLCCFFWNFIAEYQMSMMTEHVETDQDCRWISKLQQPESVLYCEETNNRTVVLYYGLLSIRYYRNHRINIFHPNRRKRSRRDQSILWITFCSYSCSRFTLSVDEERLISDPTKVLRKLQPRVYEPQRLAQPRTN